MLEYIEPPDERIQTVGTTSLFRMHLSSRYGESFTRSFNEVYDTFPNAQLQCPNPKCNRAYSISGDWCSDEKCNDGRLFHEHTDTTKVVFEKGADGVREMGPPRIVCDKNGPEILSRTFKQFDASCKHCGATLGAGQIGNEQKTIIDVYLLTLTKLEDQDDVVSMDTYCTTPFLEGMLSVKNVPSAQRLANERFLECKNVPKRKWHLWKITGAGKKYLEEITKPLQKDMLLTRLEEYFVERREKLQECVQIYDSVNQLVGISPPENKIKKSKQRYRIVHIPPKEINKIFASDHEEFWKNITK